jgi:hypothetical protein
MNSTLGSFIGKLVYFPRVGVLFQENSGSPGQNRNKIKSSENNFICIFALPLQKSNAMFFVQIQIAEPQNAAKLLA